jgi:hypothetical protein
LAQGLVRGRGQKIWTLTAGRMIPSGVNPLQSQEMLLNGKLLALEGASTLHLPTLQGKALAGGDRARRVELAATSYDRLSHFCGRFGGVFMKRVAGRPGKPGFLGL